jgi:hypothetical protein
MIFIDNRLEPVIVHHGYIVGIWRSANSDGHLSVRVQLFASPFVDNKHDINAVKRGISDRLGSLLWHLVVLLLLRYSKKNRYRR